MANYNSTYRTNYFKVTDEEEYQKLFEKVKSCAEDLADFSRTEDGETLHGFGGYGSIDYCDENEEYLGIDSFFDELSKILPDNEAVIYTEVGNEKLNYLAAYSIVATNEDVKIVDLRECAKDKAKEMLNDKDYETQLEY